MVAFSLLSALSAEADNIRSKYTVTDLGVNTYPVISNRGDVAVTVSGPDGLQHAFLYVQGTRQDIGTLPGFDSSEATAINDKREVVGVSYSASTGSSTGHAFLYKRTKMIDLGPGLVSGINDSGEMTGYLIRYPVTSIAFEYLGGRTLDIATIAGVAVNPAAGSSGIGINDGGQVVGVGVNSTSRYGFLYSNGQFQNLGTFQPTAINSHGQMVGTITGGPHVPYLYSGGNYIELILLPGTSLSDAYSINNAGKIIGRCYDYPDLEIETPYIYRDGRIYNLQNLLASPGWIINTLGTINDAGQIGATATKQGFPHEYHGILLTP